MQGDPKRKTKLLNIFLLPLIGIVVLQGVLLLSLLFFSGVKKSMERSEVEMDVHILENRQMALRNTMINEWGSLTGESETCSLLLQQVLKEQNLTVEQFLTNRGAQERYLELVFPEMITRVQQKSISGGFLVLANGESVDEAADYTGFFLRDSDPTHKTATNTDLLVERGNKNLARIASIPLDNAWSKNFHLEGKGVRESDNFFYEPYTAGVQHADSRMINLGYWSMPFVLEDSYMDNHYMITYSLPLLYDGTIYGVLGIEASVNSIEDYMDVRSLDQNLNAGYLLVREKDGQGFQRITGKGILYEYVSNARKEITIKEAALPGLYLVEGVKVGAQKVYAMRSALSLYSNNVPYDNTGWELWALVTENSIFETGRSLYEGIVEIVLGGIVLGIIVVLLVVRKVMNPFFRLMNSVSGGVEGIRRFVPSGITEIDELHNVVEHVTESQKRTEDILIEEKERYRLAMESSQDIFFTYRKQEQCLEIVNTEGYDGTWEGDTQARIREQLAVHPQDRAQLTEAFRGKQPDIEVEFRMKQHREKDYEWYMLYASVIFDDAGKVNMIVGYLHNINLQKERELEESRKKTNDPVTGFYYSSEGLRLTRESRDTEPWGVLAMLRIENFRLLNEQFGLIFGDILMEQLAEMLRRACDVENAEKRIFARAGASELAVWFPKESEQAVEELLLGLREQFAALSGESTVKLGFLAGLAAADDQTGIYELVDAGKAALSQAERKHKVLVRYEQLSEQEREAASGEEFESIVSMGYTKQMGLVSIALNLFDRGGSIPVQLDLLAVKLQQQYGMTNLQITTYNKENMVNSLEYSWKKDSSAADREPLVSCEETVLLEFAGKELTLYSIQSALYQKPMFMQLLDEMSGVALNMTDNGQYSGTIFFEGVPEAVLEDETKRKELKELATVIQNRLNQEKHDLSAQAKADFLARMSHEIRTPMNGIIGMTEIALKEGQSPEKRVDCLQKIRGSSQYLLSLVNDILDMSKIESGKMQITETRVNLKKKLQSLYPLIESKITEKHMQYTEDIRMTHAWYWVDELRVSQVLVNIIGNAIKYTNEGGSIRFTVTEHPVDEEQSELTFSVTDNGIGISADDQQRVFQSFEQARNQDGVYRQGTGLGLAISNRLIHLMGSSIQLESELGKGSTFHFTLRLRMAEAEPENDNQAMEEVHLEGKRILVVEDNELNREIIQTILENYGICVETAEDGVEAVEMVKASAPDYYDMVLMDIMMPRMNGMEATREIRKLDRPDSRTIPIIAMTANAFAEEQKQSVASGMNAHLTKPLDMEKLQKTLKEYLNGRNRETRNS